MGGIWPKPLNSPRYEYNIILLQLQTILIKVHSSTFVFKTFIVGSVKQSSAIEKWFCLLMVLPLHKSLESVLKVYTFLLMGTVLSSNVIIYIFDIAGAWRDFIRQNQPRQHGDAGMKLATPTHQLLQLAVENGYVINTSKGIILFCSVRVHKVLYNFSHTATWEKNRNTMSGGWNFQKDDAVTIKLTKVWSFVTHWFQSF